MPIVDDLSLKTTPIMLMDGEKLVLQGTGFFFAKMVNGIWFPFLVTNHHVLTGFSPEQIRQSKGDSIIFQVHIDENNPGKVRTIQLPLVGSFGLPTWRTRSHLINKA